MQRGQRASEEPVSEVDKLKESVMYAEALERLTKAKLEEAQAATALAKAEFDRIDAELAAGSDEESEVSEDHNKSARVRSCLDSQEKRRIPINDNVAPLAAYPAADPLEAPGRTTDDRRVSARSGLVSGHATTTSHANPPTVPPTAASPRWKTC